MKCVKESMLLIIFGIFMMHSRAQSAVEYGYPVKFVSLDAEGKSFRMAYMDITAEKPNGKTILLLHGKNFNGFYWKQTTAFLRDAGYRVIVPDQVGWGKSDRPDLHYSFHLLAANTKKLLDSLQLNKVTVIGHSMGGMLAARFSLLYPQTVEKMILENPIGLEDYKTFVPYQPSDSLFAKEHRATYQSYKEYQKSYYPIWKEEYEPLVAAQAADLERTDFRAVAFANAITYQMIYEQPVCYEFKNIKAPVLLIIGLADRTIVGKDRLTADQKMLHGQYPVLGKQTQQKIKGSKLVELPGTGHIPHIQTPEEFKKRVLAFIK